MNLRVVIIGSGGRLGAALAREWSGVDVTGFNHASLDIGNAEAVRAALEPLEFDVLVNCAAQTNVDRCETHPEEAFLINSKAVAVLGRVCEEKGSRCIHISTDYVFDGEKRAPYTEEDEARPISVYGASKLAGERELLAISSRHLVVRVAWVFGPDRPSFIDGILNRALENEQVEAIGDKISVPTFTLDAARLLRPLLSERLEGGIVHLANQGECTWQEYGQHAINCAAAAGVKMKGRAVAPLKMADLKAFIAKRPVYTALSSGKLANLGGVSPRPWKEAVEDYVRNYWAPRRQASGI
ncbi:MAG: dTDP-4-dehydrorhamnose reductase [Alphaproteobacteria bacterium]|nr:dTDP-4-dehydrorhamnose reductase [Alphaproteobacteria bacterium]